MINNTKYERTVHFLKNDIQRADEDQEPLVFIGKGTAKDALTLLEFQHKEIERLTNENSIMKMAYMLMPQWGNNVNGG